MTVKTVSCKQVVVIAALISLCIIFLTVPHARAAGEGIKLGGLRIYPAIQVQETYNSNIFLTADNEEDDFITSVTPSLKFLLPFEDYFIQVDGEASFIRYKDNSKDDNDIYKVSASIGADFPGGLGFVLADTFTRNYLPTQFEFDIAEYYEINQLYAKVDYSLRESFKLDLEYFRYSFTYDESDDLDRVENTYAATLYYKFLPKTSALIEAGFSDLAYNEEIFQFKDNEATQVRAGIKWAMTGKSTGEIRLGYQWKNYSDESVDDGEYFVAIGSMTTAFSRYSLLEIELRRATVESDYTYNPHYLSTRAKADISRNFTYKITGTAGLFIRRDDYPNETTELDQTAERSDNILGGHVGLNFQMLKWLAVNLNYKIQSRQSNLDVFDYDETLVKLALKAAF